MKLYKRIFIIFILILLLSPLITWGQQTEEAVKITKEVGKVIQAHLDTREPRMDISLSCLKTLYFPYQNDYYTVFPLLYFILGMNLGDDGQFKFEVSYIYKKGEQDVVKYEPKVENAPSPLVSVPLGLLFEEKKLEPGECTLEIGVKDKNQ